MVKIQEVQPRAREGIRDSHAAPVSKSSTKPIKPVHRSPSSPLHHKLVMSVAVLGPLAGLAVGISLLWQFGWMGWSYLLMFAGGWILTSLGVTVGFHRLMSHKAFETYRLVRAFWTFLGSMSIEGPPLVWCAVHRRHHGHSDQAGDPHSPHLSGPGWWGAIKGFWHSQVGWLFTGYWTRPELGKYVPDLMKDRLLVWVNRFYYLFVLASLAIPAALGYGVELWLGDGTRSPWFGAFLGFLWGGLVRILWTHHVTWSINSVCHLFGKKHFESDDESTNNFWCALLSMGEGWHNNHHAFPSSARHGLYWYQFDLSWWIIRLMQACRLAWNVHLPSQHALAARRIETKRR